MTEPSPDSLAHYFWTAVGIGGGLLFYGRFYVQWLVSEVKKKSVIPVAFWYMSTCGSLMLLTFAVWSQSPLGALGQNLNIIVYSRNLVHIWRERGRLTPALNWAVHATVGIIAAVALTFVALTWLREYEINRAAPAEAAKTAWTWLAVGVLGQALFALRFLIQWIATEIRRKSVVPTVFWYLSIVAASLQCAAFTQRKEWVFAAGMVATILIYGRNLWFLHRGPERSASFEGGAQG